MGGGAWARELVLMPMGDGRAPDCFGRTVSSSSGAVLSQAVLSQAVLSQAVLSQAVLSQSMPSQAVPSEACRSCQRREEQGHRNSAKKGCASGTRRKRSLQTAGMVDAKSRCGERTELRDGLLKRRMARWQTARASAWQRMA
jgi:hypothetical protein